MPDETPDTTPRHYSDKEVGLILRRAAEMQRSQPMAPDPTGFTLAELEDVAREAGIDARHLRQAAAEIDAPGGASSLAAKLLGAPPTIRLERTVPGELPESRFSELVPFIEAATEGHGQASAVGRTLTWSSLTAGNTSSEQVLISSSHGETFVRIEQKLNGLAGGLFGGIIGGGGMGAGIAAGGTVGGVVGSVALGVGLPVVLVGGSYWLARTIFVHQVRKRRLILEELMQRIIEVVQDAVHERTLEASDATPPADRRLHSERAEG